MLSLLIVLLCIIQDPTWEISQCTSRIGRSFMKTNNASLWWVFFHRALLPCQQPNRMECFFFFGPFLMTMCHFVVPMYFYCWWCGVIESTFPTIFLQKMHLNCQDTGALVKPYIFLAPAAVSGIISGSTRTPTHFSFNCSYTVRNLTERILGPKNKVPTTEVGE